MQDTFEKFTLSIEQIGKNLQKYKNGRAAEFGLRGIHVMCLYQLDKHPEGMTAAKLTEACAVNRAFISRLLAELISLGYVEYADGGEAKRYRLRLLLTPLGKKTVQDMNRSIREAVSEVGNQINIREMVIFYSVLRRIDRRLAELVSTVCTEEAEPEEIAGTKEKAERK